jgi:MYXO-CTERM domain-containing protein
VTPPKDAGSDAAGGSGGSGGAAADSGSVKPDAKDGSLGGWPEAAASWDSGPSAADGATAGSLFAGPEQSQDGCSCEAPGAKARRGFEGVWAWIAAGLALVRRRRGRSHEAIGDRKSARQEP